MKINRIGSYFKGKTLENGAEFLDVYDNFCIDVENEDITINAIGKIDEKGYYFHVLSLHKNGKIYRAERYHRKYLVIVRDTIFEYYKENDMVAWLK